MIRFLFFIASSSFRGTKVHIPAPIFYLFLLILRQSFAIN
ncbi:hypothetical protein M128_1029 [Bacteroides fragilis str. S6L8]|jgi:hypothetical protein|uniref:Uncharacterized protein n=7 Tax=Bacteroides fragilis TaxID=817 RepID=A0A015W0L8_BACFG|nr:hypothetical protein HMPREF0101_00102 [Bacteroides fragilis]EXY14266.1 hypothetical protein M101_0962 [Bacteroides fragilis str. 1007-1-F \